MRLSLGLSALLAAPLLLLSGVQASAADHAAKWAAEAASSTDGIINVDTAGYDAILQGDPDEGRTYGVTVVLTALPEQYKCTPCHEFAPVYHRVADSWSRVTPKATRDKHFFVSLDFSAGQGIFQRLGLSSAPTVYYYPPTAGPRAKNGDTAPQHYDLNRAGLSLANLHMWASSTTPAKFELYEPRSLAPFVIGPLVLASVLFTAWTARALLLPIVTSRWIWGAASLLGVLIGTTGHMWVKIKQAPYVQATREGGINWIAGGYSNQLGLEGQIMALLYGACGFCIIVLTVFIPAQSSPFKQRVGTLLWVGFLVALFSIIIRIFRIKNGGYPFGLL